MPYRYSKALTKLALMVYSTVLGTTIKLLHCVHVEGVDHPLRLYLAAENVRCYEPFWQKLMFIVLIVLLVPFPALLWLLMGFLRTRHRAQQLSGGGLGILRVVQGPFRADSPITMSWESVVLFRRLIMIALSSLLATEPFWQSTTLATANIVALYTHLLYLPYTDQDMQQLETFCLTLLVALSLLMAHGATFAELVAGSAQLTASFQHDATAITIIEAVIIMLPVCGLACVWLWRSLAVCLIKRQKARQ
jgi:hypothetical protein